MSFCWAAPLRQNGDTWTVLLSGANADGTRVRGSLTVLRQDDDPVRLVSWNPDPVADPSPVIPSDEEDDGDWREDWDDGWDDDPIGSDYPGDSDDWDDDDGDDRYDDDDDWAGDDDEDSRDDDD